MIGIEMGKNVDSELLRSFGENGPLTKYGGVYLVHNDEQMKVLKPLRVGAGQAFFISKLLSKQEDCNVLPRFIRPVSGRPYLWYKGSRYMMTQLLEGRAADYLAINDLQVAIQTMKVFHEFGGGLVREDPRGWKQLTIDLLDIWHQRYREMTICRSIAIRERTEWARQYMRQWHYFEGQVRQALCELRNCRKADHKVICYHDWAFHNVIIKHETAYLFDFDFMVVDLPVHDKCNLIGRYLRLFDWTRDSLFTILWNFDRYYPWQSGELKLLRIFLTLPYDFWILGRQYFIEKQPWSKKYYQEQWQRKIMNVAGRQRVLDLLDKFE